MICRAAEKQGQKYNFVKLRDTFISICNSKCMWQGYAVVWMCCTGPAIWMVANSKATGLTLPLFTGQLSPLQNLLPSSIIIHYCWWGGNFKQKLFTLAFISTTQLAWAVEYTDCISVEGQDTAPVRVLDMTQNHLMVRLWSWSVGEYGVPPLMLLLPGPLWPSMLGSHLWVK